MDLDGTKCHMIKEFHDSSQPFPSTASLLLTPHKATHEVVCAHSTLKSGSLLYHLFTQCDLVVVSKFIPRHFNR